MTIIIRGGLIMAPRDGSYGEGVSYDDRGPYAIVAYNRPVRRLRRATYDTNALWEIWLGEEGTTPPGDGWLRADRWCGYEERAWPEYTFEKWEQLEQHRGGAQ